jgi:hypothetical protein
VSLEFFTGSGSGDFALLSTRDHGGIPSYSILSIRSSVLVISGAESVISLESFPRFDLDRFFFDDFELPKKNVPIETRKRPVGLDRGGLACDSRSSERIVVAYSTPELIPLLTMSVDCMSKDCRTKVKSSAADIEIRLIARRRCVASQFQASLASAAVESSTSRDANFFDHNNGTSGFLILI